MSHLNLLKSSLLGFVCLLLSSGIALGQITSAGNGNWGTGATWVGGVVPVATDDVVIAAGHTVTLNVNTATTLNSLSIDLGGILSATGTNTVDAGTITVNGTYINGSTGAITVTTMDVNGGATYIHAINGGAIPTATWAATSILNITGVTTGVGPAPNSAPSNLNQSFGDFNWNSSGQTTNVYLKSDITIQGDFNVINTGLPYDPGSRALRMSPDPAGASYTINVGGDLVVSNTATFKMNNGTGSCIMNVSGDFILNGGNYTISTGPANSTLNVTGDVNILGGTLLMQEDNNLGATGILNVAGNLTIAAGATITETEANGTGEIYFSGGSTQTFTDGGIVSNVIDFTVNSGSTLQMATAGTSIDGDGTFTLSSGATLGITSAAGITSAGTTGNVQVTGSRTYDTGANYIYNGSSNQSAGNGLPATVNSLTINNSGGGGNNTVSLALSSSVTGALTVTQGIFDMMANNITSVGSVDMTGTSIIGSGTLTLSGNVTTNASAVTSIISAPIALGGADRTFSVAENTAVPDLNITSIISGSDMVIKTGAGSMSLSAANTYSGGTSLSVGNLNINNATAIGTGALTIAGGAIDNTSGGAIALTNNNVQSWNSDFAFAGTNNLNLGSGAVTPSGNRQITVSGSNLTVGGVIAGGAISITKLGSGALTLSGSNTFSGGVTLSAGTLNINNVNALGNIAGTFTINGGIVDNTSGGSISTANYPQAWNGDFAFTGTDDLDLGTGNVSIGSNRQLTVNGGTLAVGGTISAAAVDLTKAGGGTLNFGANPVTLNGLTISGGTLLSTSGILTLSGNFNNSGTFINNSGTVLYNGASAQGIASVSYHNLTLSGAGQKNATNSVNVANNLNNSAVLDMATFTLSVTGVTTNSGTIRFSGSSNGLALNDGTIEYYGSSQTVTSGTYNNLDINQSGGEAILGGATNVNGTLTLIARNLNLGGFKLTLGPSGTISVASPSATKMIIAGGGGQVIKNGLNGLFTFPIGDNIGMTEYSPVDVNVTVGGPSNITVSVEDAKHPNNTSTTNFISRYWNVTSSVGVTANLTGTYLGVDINGAEGSTSSAQLDGTFNQSSNPWNKYVALGGNTLTAAAAPMTAGQASIFTGISGADPTVSIAGGGVTICEGSSVALTATGVGDPVFTYSWSPVAGLSSSTIANPIASPITTTLYTVTATDGNGIVINDNTTITVNPAPTLTGAVQSATVCAGIGAVIDLTGLVPSSTSTVNYSINGVGQPPVAGVVADGTGVGNFTTSILSSANDGQTLQITGFTITSAAPNCSQTFTQNLTLSVDAPAVITSQPISATSCEGDVAVYTVTASGTDLQYSWEEDQGGGFAAIVDGGIYSGSGTSTLTLTGITSAMDTWDYQVVVSIGGGSVCVAGVTSASANLTVNTMPEVIGIISSNTVCQGSGVLFTVNSGATTIPTFQWQESTNGGVTYSNLVDNIKYGGSLTNALTINPTVLADDGNLYRVIVSGTCSPSVISSSGLLTVDEIANVTTDPVNTTECENGSVSFTVVAGGDGLTYQWRENGGNLADGGIYTGALTSTLTLTGITSGENGNTYDVVVTNSTPACLGNSDISSAATLTVDTDPVITVQPVASQAICEGIIANFSVTATGTGLTYQWRKDGVDIGGATASLYSIGATVTADAGSYTVIVSGSCGSPVSSNASVLTILEQPEISSQPVSQTVCENTGVTFSVVAGVTSSPTYQWRKGGTPIGGATSSSYSIVSVVPGDAGVYDVVVSSGVACGAAATSAGATLTVDTDPVITVQPVASQAICEGIIANFSVTATGTGLTYQWRKDGVDIGGATASLYSIGATVTADAGSYTVIVSGSCGSPVSSNASVLTILEQPEISSQPVSQTVCENTGVTFSVVAGVTSSPTYQWRKGGTPIGGATSSSYSIVSVVPGDAGVYDVVVSSGVACGAAATSAGATLTVDTDPVITVQPVASQAICEGIIANFSVTATGTGLTYQWRKDGVDIGGATASLYSIGATVTADAGSYTVIVSGSCGSPVSSNASVLTILEQPEISSQPVSQTVCENTGVTFSVVAGVTSSPTYQWRKGGTPIGGATSSSYSIVSVVPGDAGVYDVVVSSGVACGAAATSAGATLTVDTDPVITVQPVASQAICEGIIANFSVTATGTGLTYQWRKDGVDIGGATASLYSIGATVTADAGSYTVIVSGSCGSPVSSNASVLTILEQPEISSQPVSQTVCENTGVTFSVVAGVTSSPTYQWRKGGTPIGGATSSSYSIVSVVPGDAGVYDVVVSSGVACGAAATSAGATLTVDTDPVITVQPVASQAICEGIIANFSVTATGTGLTYQWRKDGVDIGGATASLYSIGATVTADAGSYTVIVSGSCGIPVSSNASVLTILEQPEISSQPVSQTVCENTGVTFSVVAGVTSSPTYQWRKGGTPIGGATSSSYSIVSVVPGDAGVYDVVVSSGVACGAAATSAGATLTVDTDPVITVQPVASQAICEGIIANFSVTATGTGLTYQWRKDGVDIGGATASLYSIGATVTADAGSYTVIVSGSCGSPVSSNASVLTILEQPEISSQPVSQTVCENTGVTFSVVAGVTSSPTYQWRKGGTPIGGATSSSYSIVSVVPGDAGVYDVVVSSGVACGAAATSAGATLTVDTDPVITVQPVASQAICEGIIANFSVTATGTGLTYQWRKDGVDIGGATASLYSIGATVTADAGSYTVIVSGSCGSPVSSNASVLTILEQPEISSQPVSQTVCENTGVTFSVVAGVTSSPTYQWRKGGTPIGGATSSSYSIVSVVPGDAGVYDVVVSSGVACGAAATSAGATLTVDTDPVITVQPVASQAICEGIIANFSVTATGTGLTYQWRKDGVDIGGATASLYSIGATVTADAGSYTVIVSGSCGSPVSSNASVLTILEQPEISSQPVSQTVCENTGVTFSVVAGVTSSPTYQWRKGGTPIGGATSSSYSIVSVVPGDAGVYDVVVSSGVACGAAATSAGATLTVDTDPVITVQPVASQAICEGIIANFSVTATGTGLTYQWRKDGVDIGGATASLYSIGATVTADAGSYTVIVSGSCGIPVSSNASVLTILEQPEISSQPVSQTVCENTGVTFSVVAGVTSSPTYQWRKGGTPIGGATSSSYSIVSVVPGDAGVYDVVVSSGVACGAAATSAGATLTVDTDPVITVQPVASQAICEGIIANFSVTATGTGLTYQWRKDGVDIGGATASLYSIGATVTADAGSYTVIVSGSCGSPVSSNASVLTIEENAVITVSPLDVTECEGGTVTFNVTASGTDIQYQWRENGGNIADGGIYSGSTTPVLVLTGLINGLNGNTYDVVVSNGVSVCVASVTSALATLTVTAAPIIDAGVADQTCDNASYTVTDAVANNVASILWTHDGLGSITAGTELIINPEYNPVAGDGGNIVTLTLTVIGNGSCAGAVDTKSLAVNSLPVANAGVGGSECDLDFIFSAIKSIPTSIGTWTMDSGPGTPTFANANGPSSLVTVDTYGSYDFRWTEDNNGCTDFQVITVLFEEQPIANAGVGGDVCGKDAGNPFTFTGVASVGLGTWSLTSGPGTESFSSINSATSDVTVDTYGTYVFRWTEVNGGCSDFAEVTVSYYEQPVAFAGTGGNVCGTSFNLNGSRSIPLSGGIWTVDNKPAAATVIFADINSPSSLVTIDVFGNYLLRWTETNVACSDFDQVSLNFQPQPVVDAGADGEICGKDAGSPFTFTGTATGLGGSLGFWSNETPAVGNATFNPPSGIDDPTAEVTVDAYGTYIFRYTEFAGFCSDFDEVTVRFKEIPIVAAADEIICSGETSNVIITNPNTIPGTTFTWVVNSSTNINGESGGSGAVISQLLTSADGVNPGSVTYEITPFGDNCIGLPILTTVTVNPIPDVLATPAAETICDGASTSIALSTPNLVAGTLYTWVVAQTGVSTATDQAIPVAGPITQALVLDVANVPGSVTYTITPVSPDNCLGAPIDVIVTVDPVPDVAAPNETICSGETSNVVITNPNTVPGTSFSWTVSASTNVTGASAGAGGIIAQVLTSADGFNQGTVDYSITPLAGGCPGTPIIITVAVDPTPDVLATPAAETICSGQTTNIALSTPNMVASTTYNWTVSVIGGITGAFPSTGNTIAQTLVNPGNTTGIVTYTITPTASGCAGLPINVNVVVNPTPTVATSGNETICSGSTTTIALSNPNTIPGTTFTWSVVANSNVSGDAPGLGNNIIQTLSSTDGVLFGTVTYEVIAFTGGCFGDTTTVDVTVNPDVLVAAGGDQIVCEGSDLVLGGSITGGVTTGTWSTAGDGMFDNTGFGIGTIYSPGATDISTGNVLITLTADDVDGAGGPCPVRLDQFTLTINPIATVSVAPDFAICEPISIPLSGTIGGGATGGLWQVISGNGGLSASSLSGNTVSADYFPDVTDVNSVVIMRLITNDPDGPSEPCTTVSADINITIDESAKVTAGANQEICEDVSAPLNGNIFGSVATGMWTIVSGGDGNFDNANDPLTNYNPGPNDQLLGAVVTLRLTTDNPGTTCGITFAETMVTVNKLPEVFLTGLLPSYQEDDLPVTLTGFPTTGGVGVFSGPAVVGNQFFPSVANLSPILNTVVYTFTNAVTGCSNFDSFDVIVNPVTTVNFTVATGIPNGLDTLDICSDVGLLDLIGFPDISTGIPPSNFFSSIPLMNARIINPTGAARVDTDGLPSGVYDIKYTYFNSLGVESSKVNFIRVYAGPIANFDVGNFCVDSPIAFTDLSTLGVSPFPGSIDTWNWNFGDGVVDNNQDPNHLYAIAQDYTVTLSVTTDQGCTSKPVGSQTITIGAVPSVAYESSEFCTGDITEFASLPIDWGTQIPSAITDYTWIFGDGDTLSTGAVPAAAHVYPGSARYDVSMTVTTQDGCQATDLHPIDVFPFNPIIIPNEYSESFEGPLGTSGWFEGAEDFIVLSDTSWIEGPPTGNVINTASDGTNVWWTGASTLPDHPYYYPGEKSVVNAPCFDITSLTRPMISIDTWNDTQEGFDGLVLQYSTDGGVFWFTIGQVGNGVEWYNTTGILGKPGGDQNGWSGSTGGWVTSRFSLEQVPVGSRNKVRLRMAFGSNEDNPIGANLNGFAFDNVTIRERNRITLVENFTSLTNTDYSAISTKMLDFEVQRPNDFIYLNYHIPFPGEDSLFTDNRSEPQTRANSFGISQSIQAAIDGNIYLGNASGWPIEVVDGRALVDPQFNIDLQILPTGSDSLSVMWDVIATEAVENPIIVHTVVIEEQVTNGSSTAYNVVKKLLPNAAGSSNVSILRFDSGDVYSAVRLDWQIDKRLYAPDQLAVVVFAQEKTNGGEPGEIYQVAYAKVPGNKTSSVVTGIDDVLEEIAQSIEIYPNPVAGELHFVTSNKPGKEFNWRVVDQRGVELMADNFKFINGQYSVDTRNIPNGVYYLIISARNQPLTYKKIIVMHR